MHTAPNDSTDSRLFKRNKQVNIALNSLSGRGGGIFLQSSKVVIDCRPRTAIPCLREQEAHRKRLTQAQVCAMGVWGWVGGDRGRGGAAGGDVSDGPSNGGARVRSARNRRRCRIRHGREVGVEVMVKVASGKGRDG